MFTRRKGALNIDYIDAKHVKDKNGPRAQICPLVFAPIAAANVPSPPAKAGADRRRGRALHERVGATALFEEDAPAAPRPPPTERMTASQKGGPASAERGPHGARCESDRKRTRRPPAPHCRKVPHNGRCRGFIAARTAARSPVCRTCGKPRYRAQLRQRSGRRTTAVRLAARAGGKQWARSAPLPAIEEARVSDRGGDRNCASLVRSKRRPPLYRRALERYRASSVSALGRRRRRGTPAAP